MVQAASSPDILKAQLMILRWLVLKGNIISSQIPAPQPASLASTGWSRFTNITGLVTGVTNLGDELSMMYNLSDINSSVFANSLNWVWNGTKSAKPRWHLGKRGIYHL